MIRFLAPALLTCLLLGAAPVPKWTEAEKEQAKLQGKWCGVAVATARQQSNNADDVLTFDNGTFTLTRRGKVLLTGTFTIDPSTNPKAIDMIITGGNDQRLTGKVALGVYQLDKDTLKWCMDNPISVPNPKRGPVGRPQEITPAKDSDQTSFTFKKGKP